jgi:DNA-directed RNA polymerase specialized sigma24 family protein
VSAPTPHGNVLTLLFSRHHPWLLQRQRLRLRLRLRLRNHSDAEDLVAEAFCQLPASRVDAAKLIEPRAYLSTIAQRLAFHVTPRSARFLAKISSMRRTST